MTRPPSAWATFNATRPTNVRKPRVQKPKKGGGMKLDTITLPVKEAREKVAEYRRAVRQRHNDEDEAILRGYRALAKGHALVDVVQAIKGGGEDENGFPRIAVCQAEAKWCYLERDAAGNVGFYPNDESNPRRSASWRRTRGIIRVRNALTPYEGGDRFNRTTSPWTTNAYRTQVPVVPPALRAATSLKPYHILWEVEQWAKYVPPRPPGDPALLKHISGTLYAVVAMWDLTELERAVLGARQ